MKNCPIHFYWGRKNGLIVTRDTESGSPEILYADNRLSLEKLKKAAAATLVVLLIVWRITRRVRRFRSRHSH